MTNTHRSPFSVPINVRRLPKKGHFEKYSATEEVRSQLAEVYELVSIEQFDAHASVAPWKRDGVKITGEVRSNHTQYCAVTGDPLSVSLREEVEAILVPEGSTLARPRQNDEGELIFDVEGDDLPEVFTGDSIDLANVWLEFFTLGLDPYARKEGEEFNSDSVNTPKESPFSVLSDLKTDIKK